MANDSIIRKVFSISPHIEMISRRLYWSNVKWLSNRVKKNKNCQLSAYKIDFEKIADFLRTNGVINGKLLVVHSAYAPFKGRGRTPNQIIDMLFDIVGKTGTVAMPAMPKFNNSIDVIDYLSEDSDRNVYNYDVAKSSIKTGVLPLMLHKRQGSVRSRHPINTMVALGPLAKKIMQNNLEGESPLACGKNSSWYNCVEHDAVIIGLGTDLTHSLTMIHVAEDTLDEKWPIKDWYVEKSFTIKDGNFEDKRMLRERSPKWGALHFGERTLCKDLINKGILKSTNIDGITVETIRARELMYFLNSKNSNGYPYFWVRK
jgi:aminoglycoside 3-N-acetyltransferase